MLVTLICVASVVHPQIGEAGQVVQGADVKVTRDNNNVDAGFATPSLDGRNLEQNEPSVAVSSVKRNVLAIGSNDFRLNDLFAAAPTTSGTTGVNVSTDGGATWFNTQIPGFPADTSPTGLASPLKGMQGLSDPTVRFDAAGNLYVSALAFVAISSVPGVTPVPDNLVFVTKYRYTPGTPAGVSTPHSAGNPPDFTYAFTTVVELGSLTFLPDPAFFNTFIPYVGNFEDKTWLAVDTNAGSPCFGNVYMAWTSNAGVAGAGHLVFSRSTDGGVSFTQPVVISQKGQGGNQLTVGASIASGPDGRVFVAYRAFASNPSDLPGIDVARSDDCGRHFEKPVMAAPIVTPMRGREPGLTFRTPTLPALAVDDTNPNTAYVAYIAKTGNPSNANIFVARSTDGGDTWESPVQVNDDSTSKHQFFPTVAVSGGYLHIGWYDLRDSPSPGDPAATNDALNTYYAFSNAAGALPLIFSGNIKVSDVGQQPNCLFGSSGFMGDYIELAAYFNGTAHDVHFAWADNRDIPPGKCDLDPAPGPNDLFTGQRNQNIYTDRLIVMP